MNGRARDATVTASVSSISRDLVIKIESRLDQDLFTSLTEMTVQITVRIQQSEVMKKYCSSVLPF